MAGPAPEPDRGGAAEAPGYPAPATGGTPLLETWAGLG